MSERKVSEIQLDKARKPVWQGYPIYAGSFGAAVPALIEIAHQLQRIADALEKEK